eukprot:PLAT13436.1.p2 GENE.PLAT13436.1~~PLAT13436.1.p2  ORF type:complete len:338 (+),score=180.03 PLAT13436.1:34-1047(+)
MSDAAADGESHASSALTRTSIVLMMLYGATCIVLTVLQLWMMPLLLMVAAPPLFVLYAFYWRSQRRTVPLSSMINITLGCFFGGSVMALVIELILSLLLGLIVNGGNPLSVPTSGGIGHYVLSAVLVSMVAGFVEEPVKYFWAFGRWSRCKFGCAGTCAVNARDPWGIMMLGLASAAGFSWVENYLYVMRSDDFGAALALVGARGLLSLPVHGLCTSMTALNVIRRDVKGEPMNWVKASFLGALLHTFFDTQTILFGLGAGSLTGVSIVMTELVLIVYMVYVRRTFKSLAVDRLLDDDRTVSASGMEMVDVPATVGEEDVAIDVEAGEAGEVEDEGK